MKYDNKKMDSKIRGDRDEILYFLKDFKIFIGFWLNGKTNGIGKYMKYHKEKFGIWKNGKVIKWFKDKEEIYQYEKRN